MPRQGTARLDASYGWLRGEDWWGDPVSDNMVLFDALLHPRVRSLSQPGPPSVTFTGDQYIVGPTPAGAWAGYPNAIATRYDDRWRFVTAFRGLRVFVDDLDGFFWFNGTNWVSEKDGSSGVDVRGTKYDFLCSVGYPPEPNEVLLVAPIPETMTLPLSGAGSLATCLAPPGRDITLELLRNGAQIGIITFGHIGFEGAIVVPNQVVFAPGDRLVVRMGPTQDEFGDFGNFGVLFRFITPLPGDRI